KSPIATTFLDMHGLQALEFMGADGGVLRVNFVNGNVKNLDMPASSTPLDDWNILALDNHCCLSTLTDLPVLNTSHRRMHMCTSSSDYFLTDCSHPGGCDVHYSLRGLPLTVIVTVSKNQFLKDMGLTAVLLFFATGHSCPQTNFSITSAFPTVLNGTGRADILVLFMPSGSNIKPFNTASNFDCCLRHTKRVIPFKAITGFTEQLADEVCDINAIIFYTAKKLAVCADPKQGWVKRVMHLLRVKGISMPLCAGNANCGDAFGKKITLAFGNRAGVSAVTRQFFYLP
ncbi:hypothetical protein STEG23_014356, partial [Scotinomys teguina]